VQELAASGGEVIPADYARSPLEELFSKITANESGCAGYKVFFHLVSRKL
jgi:hypothetical protein